LTRTGTSSPLPPPGLFIDGKATASKTAAGGAVVLSFDKAGVYTVSAKTDAQTLMPPVCIVTSEGKAGDTAAPLLVSGYFCTVVPGDCLWTICRRLYGSGAKWGELFELNSDVIADPRLIYPGQVLRLF